jgi:hypothetical protein
MEVLEFCLQLPWLLMLPPLCLLIASFSLRLH